jgi:hypothetical protein
MVHHRWAAAVLAGAMIGLAGAPSVAAIRVGDARTVARAVFVPNLDASRVSVRCPKGYRGIGGGSAWIVDRTPSTSVGRYLSAAIPTESGRKWVVAGSNRNVDANLKAILRCVPRASIGPVRVIRQDIALSSGRAEGFAQCATDERLVTGGAAFMVSGPPVVPSAGVGVLTGSAPVDSRTWIASGESPAGVFLRVAAVCASQAKMGEPAWRFGEVNVETHATRTVGCPDPRRVLVGGSFWKNAAGSIVTTTPLGVGRVNKTGKGWVGTGWNWPSFADRTLAISILCVRR